MKLLQTLGFIALAVAIGAVVGLLTSDMRVDGAAAGAVVGAIIGSWLILRLRAYRASIRRARQDPQEAARQEDLQAQHRQAKQWGDSNNPGAARKIDDMTIWS